MEEGQGVPAPALQDPVARISALLDADKVIPDKPPEQQPEQEQQPEPEQEPEPNTQIEGDDEPRVAEIPLDQLEAIELEVEVSGATGKQVEKLPIKELKLGYMRQKDYQTKTAEVARQREQVSEEKRQAIESERSQYVNTLQQLHSLVLEAVAPELKNVDWNHLAANDQFEYIRLKNRAEQVTQALNSVKTKQTELQSKAEADKRQALEHAAQKTWATLETDIPGWNAELYKTLMSSGESIGYKPEEVGSWVDARAIKLLHKAHLYDQMQAQKPAVEKKVINVPKVIKPGATPAVARVKQKETEALKQLKKSGSLDDAASVILSRM